MGQLKAEAEMAGQNKSGIELNVEDKQDVEDTQNVESTQNRVEKKR